MKTTPGGVVAGAILVAIVFLLWGPIVVHRGNIFTRDPSFMSTIRADWSWSLGAFTLQGGVPNITYQGIFYEPYGILIWILHFIGADAGEVSKVIPFVLSLVAVCGSYRLLRTIAVGRSGAIVAAAFYLCNPWSLDQFGYFFMWTGYCLLPWIVIGAIELTHNRRCAPWFPVAILFLGGIISWLTAALVVVTAILCTTIRNGNVRPYKPVARAGLIFATTGAYWIIPYLMFALSPPRQFLSYSSASGVLMSMHPLLNILQLRDFWWPHLNIVAAAGGIASAIGSVATSIIVVASAGWLFLLWRTKGTSPMERRLRCFLMVSVVVGVVLAAGSAGPTGPLYTFVHEWPIFGHAFVASFLRSPSNLAIFMVAGISMSLGVLTDKLVTTWMPNRFSVRLKPFRYAAAVLTGAVALSAACGPSTLAFWDTYKPISLPRYYQSVQHAIPRGTSLQIGYWTDLAVSPVTGYWISTWNPRKVADPTVLASFISGPSISPIVSSVNSLGTDLVTDVDRTDSALPVDRAAHELGVTSIVVENDIQRPPADAASLDQFLAILDRSGLNHTSLGPLTVFSLPGAIRQPIWGTTCQTSAGLLSIGLVRVSCRGALHSKAAVTSPFNLPGPIVGYPFSIGSATSVVEGVGTRIDLAAGRSGWIIFLPALLATIGLFTTCAWLVGIGVRTIWLATPWRQHIARTTR
ncbi:MAG: hypothetical protein ACYDD4_07950 [Acidimicrobiales bacterium]